MTAIGHVDHVMAVSAKGFDHESTHFHVVLGHENSLWTFAGRWRRRGACDRCHHGVRRSTAHANGGRRFAPDRRPVARATRVESIRHAASIRHGRRLANSSRTAGLVPRTDLAYDSCMKLVPKLAAALIAGTFAVLVPNGYLRVQREVAVLRSDRVRDHALLGRSLGAAVSALWRTGGRTEALAIVEGVNARGGGVHVRWVDDGTGPDDVSALQDLASGESLTRIASTPAGVQRETYVPVSVTGVRAGMIELTEPLEVEERAARRIAIDTVGTTLALALVSGALSVVLGFWLVGRPIRALSDKARRIGGGRLFDPARSSPEGRARPARDGDERDVRAPRRRVQAHRA